MSLVRVSTLAFACLALHACADTESVVMAPIVTQGSVSETIASRQFADEGRSFNNQIEASLTAQSYVWQPWFLTVATELNAAADTEWAGSDGGSDSLVGSGSLTLGAIPLSNYPTTLLFSRSDSRISNDFSEFETTSDRFEIRNQAIIASDLRTSLSASYAQVEQPTFGEETRLNGQVGFTKTFTKDRLAGNFAYRTSAFEAVADDEDLEDETDRLLLGTIAYDSFPLEDVTSQSTTTLVHEDNEAETGSLERFSLQGITTVQWRPRGQDFTVNGAWRTLTESIDVVTLADSVNASTTETTTATGTAGLNYPINPRLIANLAANGRAETISRDAGGASGEIVADSSDTIGGGLVGSLTYGSLTEQLGGFDWRWSASGSTATDIDTTSGFSHAESVSASHGIRRTLETDYLGPLGFGVNQELSIRRNDEDGVVPSLIHNASLNHSSVHAGASTFARFSVSDRRSISAEPDEFQLLQIQFSRQEVIDADNDWQGNLSLQYTRQQFGSGDATTSVSANGALSYQSSDLFGVRGLLFASELTLSAIGLEEVISGEGNVIGSDPFRSRWRNRLSGRIGMIVASLEGNIFYSQDQFGNVFLFRVRREFRGLMFGP